MRRHLTFANVMVVLLTFIVLGGGAYAATQLPKNSVGAKQLKRGAVTKAKIAGGTLKELQGTRGPIGPAGKDGSPGAPGANGAPGGTLLPGTTLRGVTVADAVAPGTGPGGGFDSISFAGSQMPSRPTPNIVLPGAATTASCPGSVAQPDAAPGNVCFYIRVSQPDDEGKIVLSDPTASEPSGLLYDLGAETFKVIGAGKLSTLGFQLSFVTEEYSSPQVIGSWAATS